MNTRAKVSNLRIQFLENTVKAMDTRIKALKESRGKVISEKVGLECEVRDLKAENEKIKEELKQKDDNIWSAGFFNQLEKNEKLMKKVKAVKEQAKEAIEKAEAEKQQAVETAEAEKRQMEDELKKKKKQAAKAKKEADEVKEENKGLKRKLELVAKNEDAAKRACASAIGFINDIRNIVFENEEDDDEPPARDYNSDIDD